MDSEICESIQSIDVNSSSFPQLIRLKEENDAEVESLCNVMHFLNKKRVKLETTIETINKFDSSIDGCEVLLPLTNSMYATGYIYEAATFTYNLGGEYLVELDKENAINHIFRKIQKVKDNIGIAQHVLADKLTRREDLRKITAEKYLEEKTKRETKQIAIHETGTEN